MRLQPVSTAEGKSLPLPSLPLSPHELQRPRPRYQDTQRRLQQPQQQQEMMLAIVPRPSDEAAALLEGESNDGSYTNQAFVPEGNGCTSDGESVVSLTYDEALTMAGVGRFHYMLLLRCGCGWLVDNLWLQGLALVLPQLQREFLPPTIGLVGSCEFGGMACGALFWGLASDRIGRRRVFTLSLLQCGVFGLACAFAPRFWSLLLLIALMGFGAGGNLPVDGALFAEFTPKNRRGALVVLLSVFWVLGAVIASLLAWVLLPAFSCPISPATSCDSLNNRGWRYLLGTLALITLLTAIVTHAGLEESPMYLLQQGRVREAQAVLIRVARTNHKTLAPFSLLPVVVCPSLPSSDVVGDNDDSGANRGFHESAGHVRLLRICGARVSSACAALLLPLGSRGTLTILLLSIWFATSFGYTGFNLYLPQLLFHKGIASENDVYRATVFYSLAGIPGALLGAWAVESRLGRKWTMALSTGGTAASVLLFSFATVDWEVFVFMCLVNFSSQVMYAAIYAYTPEAFPSSVRTTGCGVCSAASRLAGILAPLAIAHLLQAGTQIPLVVCVSMLVLALLCMCLLATETRGTALL